LECNKFEMKALVIYDRGEGLWKIWEWGSVKKFVIFTTDLWKSCSP
jgi:hypothetical protein